MLWLPLALATALTDSLKDVFSKRSLRGADVLVVAWGMRFFALALLVPATLLQGLPEIAPGFWWVLALDGGLNAIATYLYVRALNVGQLSLACTSVERAKIHRRITRSGRHPVFPTEHATERERARRISGAPGLRPC